MLGFGFAFGQQNKDSTNFLQKAEIHQLIKEAFRYEEYDSAKNTLTEALSRAIKIEDANLVALSYYSLAKLNYKFDKTEKAKENLRWIFNGKEKLEDQQISALSYLLQAKINLQNKDLEQAEIDLTQSLKIISEIETALNEYKAETTRKMELLSAENSEQQRSLEFNQLGIILGVIMVFVLSLLAMAFIKNRNIRIKTTSLLIAKNKQLTKEKNIAERAVLVKTQFLSTITHELRTPIYAVTGLTHLLMEENPTEEQKEYLKSLKFSGEHLLVLINNILDINKLEAKKVKLQESSFNLKENIENVIQALAKSANDKNNKVHLELDTSLPNKIIGDHFKLSQIMINLVSNAIKFTENGDLWIRIKHVNTTNSHLFIYFEIEDNGIGIPEATKETIFENFTQGADEINNKYGGTGLGLPIVKGILQLLGGKIGLESTLHVGSKFYFTLKFGKVKDSTLSDAEVQEKKEENLKYWQKSLEGKRILIVEDNKINQMITHKILAKHGVVCDLADSGEIALEKTKTTKYDLILMDIHMPGISGIKATKEIRKTDLQTPIIALTAVALDEDIQFLLNKGFNDVIPKPYKIPLFFQKIHDEIHGRTLS